MINIRRLLIEALKPRDTLLVELSESICSVNGVEECDINVTDVDARTETIRLVVKGPNIEYNEVSRVLQENGVSVKGIDEVSVVKTKKDATPTPGGAAR